MYDIAVQPPLELAAGLGGELTKYALALERGTALVLTNANGSSAYSKVWTIFSCSDNPPHQTPSQIGHHNG
jgi:hypothetical protein